MENNANTGGLRELLLGVHEDATAGVRAVFLRVVAVVEKVI